MLVVLLIDVVIYTLFRLRDENLTYLLNLELINHALTQSIQDRISQLSSLKRHSDLVNRATALLQ